MSCRFWSFAAALSAAVVVNGVSAARAVDDAPADEQVAEQPKESSPADSDAKPASDMPTVKPVGDAKGIEAALLKRTDAKLVEMPLRQFGVWVEETTGIQVEIDNKSLTDAGMDWEAIELNFVEPNLTLGAQLYHVLQPNDLSFVVSNDVLLITTRDHAETTVETRVYPALDLLAFRQADGSVRDDANPLMLLIQGTCSPESWETTGGQGTINTHDGLLSVSQNRRVHEQIGQLLETLRSAKQAAAEGKTTFSLGAGENAGVYSALQKATIHKQWAYHPLRQAADLIQNSVNVAVIVDERAMNDAGIDPDAVEFTSNHLRKPLNAVLARELSQFSLASIVDHGAVLITTAERAQTTLEINAYPIGDLLPDELKFGESQIQRGRALLCLVMDAADPSTWDDNGGSSRIEFAAPWNLLVVSAPTAIQHKVADSLAKLRDAKQQQAESGLAPGDAATTDDLVLLRVFKLGSVAGGDQESANKIAELVRELVPETRSNEPDNPEGPFLRTVGDRMVVMNRRSVLVKVESLLDQFESATGGKFSKATASAGDPAATK